MPRLRRLVLLVLALAALGAVASSRALAVAPPPTCPAPLPQSITSTHFIVFYDDDPTKAGFLTQVQAGTILAAAERSYASYVAAGFPTPAVMGSGKTELYVMDLTPWNLAGIYC